MSGLLHAAIERSSGENCADGDPGAAQAATPPAAGEGSAGPPLLSERSGPGLEPGRRAGGGGGGGDITQDAMAKVLHERWLSEREKAKALESRLKESEGRIGDLEEVRERERQIDLVIVYDNPPHRRINENKKQHPFHDNTPPSVMKTRGT